MTRAALASFAAILAIGLVADDARAEGRTRGSPSRARGSASREMRKQILDAQRDLMKAYAAAVKSDSTAAAVKTAQDALTKARRDYTAAFAAARKELDDNPQVAPHRKVVRELGARLSGLSDVRTRSEVASELMHARGKMNAAEAEVLAVDPDLALSKTAVADALAAFKAVQAGSEMQRQQDPGVIAARQRLADLRRQLVGS